MESTSVAVRLKQAEAAVRAALQPLLDEQGLSIELWRILAVLADDPGQPMSQVAATAVVPAATLTRHMDRLVELGLVVRRVDPEDRRRAVVALSPHGGIYVERLLSVERALGRDVQALATPGPA